MFKREIKINFKSFLVWILILIGLFLMVFLVYPSILKSDNIKMLNEMMEMFPEELLKAFNMDIASIDSAFGWLKTEGFVFLLLISGVYSGILGSSILLKEESDKTIEYLNSLPVTRKQIIIQKYLCGFLYIISMIVIVSVFNYLGLLFSGDFNQKNYFLLSITPLFSSLVIYSLCFFLSTFFHKTKKTLGISLGIVFASYFLQIMSEISDVTVFLKYFSVFTLADIRNVIINNQINWIMVIITIVLITICLILSIIKYDRKELV